MNIYKVTARITPSDTSLASKLFDNARETKSNYMVDGRRISKEDIGNVTNGVWRGDLFHFMHLEAYCLEHQLEDVSNSVRAKMIELFNRRCDLFEGMKQQYFEFKNIPSPFSTSTK